MKKILKHLTWLSVGMLLVTSIPVNAAELGDSSQTTSNTITTETTLPFSEESQVSSSNPELTETETSTTTEASSESETTESSQELASTENSSEASVKETDTTTTDSQQNTATKNRTPSTVEVPANEEITVNATKEVAYFGYLKNTTDIFYQKNNDQLQKVAKTISNEEQFVKISNRLTTTQGEFLEFTLKGEVWYIATKDFTNYGNWQPINEYVSITKATYSIWKDFKWDKALATPSKNYYQKTLQAKEKYLRGNATYYSLYDYHGNWVGYLNTTALKVANNKGGIWYKENLYGNKAAGNYTLWQDLNFSVKKGSSNDIKTQTVKITGKYRHINGSLYYSLYNKQGKWLGYINATGVKTTKNRQGTYQSYQKYGTITNAGYHTWSSFAFTAKGRTVTNHRTYFIKGLYYHYNGSTYYSLTNSKGTWLGYINSKAMTVAKNAGGIWQKENLVRKVSKKNYTIWQDLTFKKARSNTNNYYGQQLKATGKYYHYNGSLYYSLYSGSKWIGYVNATATSSPHQIYSVKSSNLYQIINNNSGNFYSQADPTGKKLGSKASYYKKMVRVTKIANTSDGSYYYATLPGSGAGLGWIKANQTYSVQNSFYMYATGGNFPSLKVSNLNIQVSISKQRVIIRSGTKPIYTMLCSTGAYGHDTPTGHFRIQAERGLWFWGASGGAAYYRSFSGHGIYLFHSVTISGPGLYQSYYHPEAIKLGRRASHGCIRLSVADAIWFYNNIPYNTPVHIFN